MIGHSVRFLEMTALEEQRAQQGVDYLEFLRESSMSAGVYVLPVGGVDRQSPHKQDEMYFVVKGRGRMRAGSEGHAVRPGIPGTGPAIKKAEWDLDRPPRPEIQCDWVSHYPPAVRT